MTRLGRRRAGRGAVAALAATLVGCGGSATSTPADAVGPGTAPPSAAAPATTSVGDEPSSPSGTARSATTTPTTTGAATTATGAITTTTGTTTTTTTTTTTATTTTTSPPPTTRCSDVAHIGDSTGVYLWDAQYVDGVANTMGERYRSVGVERWVEDSSGGRAIVERAVPSQATALEVAEAIRAGGFDGCWVVMIGTNDAANVAAGASTPHEERIRRVLEVVGDDPVLWVDAATVRETTPYANRHMRAWNDALLAVTADRANVEVLRWSERVRADWFVDDGIHMNTDGRIWRAAITASALVEAFPA